MSGPVEIDEPTNENGDGYTPDDAIYVEEYMEKALAHFHECKISHAAVSIALTDALFKYTPGNPYDKEAFEGDLWAGLSSLAPASGEIERRVKAYHKALARIQAKKVPPQDG